MISPAAKHTYTTKDSPNHPRNPFDVEKQKIESFAHKRENTFFSIRKGWGAPPRRNNHRSKQPLQYVDRTTMARGVVWGRGCKKYAELQKYILDKRKNVCESVNIGWKGGNKMLFLFGLDYFFRILRFCCKATINKKKKKNRYLIHIQMQHHHQSFRTQYNNNNNQHNKIFPTFQEARNVAQRKCAPETNYRRRVYDAEKRSCALNFTFKFILIYRCENRQRFCC